MVAGLGGAFGVSLTGALFEQLQISDIVSAAAGRGVTLSHGAAGTLSGLMSGTPSASHALAQYPAGQQAAGWPVTIREPHRVLPRRWLVSSPACFDGGGHVA